MWNKRRDEEPPKPYSPPTPPPVAPSPGEPRKETAPMSMPAGRFEPEPRGGSATIGKAVKIIGQIFSKEDLYVDGDLDGTVELLEHKLTIGPNGTVKATVKAREVVALGTIQGNVEAADKIEIRKDAKLVGDIRTARIIIEDGAYFKGSIDIVKPEPAKQPQKNQPSPQPAAVSAPGGGPGDRR
ncbi:MAG: polymer-forming cytoskeletal protein [Acidobacteriia bacterium]|nr:polymer-forming cytoskeletal protein [Terriglobia bacterium]